MRRLKLRVLIALGLVAFLAISALLARVLSLDSAERSAVTALIQAEAQGSADAMIRQIHNCLQNPACRQRAAQDAHELTRPGNVKILELSSSAGFSLGSTVGTARVAWRAGTALPVVQCLRIRRAGNAVSGQRIELLEISRRIKSSADCPARY